MKKINISKIIIIALIMMITACVAILISARQFNDNKKPSEMTLVVNDTVGGIDGIIAAPFNFFENKAAEVGNLLSTYQQNAKLSKKITQLADNAAELDSLKAENKELKAALDLQNTLTNYEKVASNVVVRNPNAWGDTMTIDKGSADGLKDDMIVMSNGGVVGRITQVNTTTSKVALLTSDKVLENKIPVRLGSAENPAYGLITGYDAQQNAFIITQISSDNQFTKVDQVVTSGLGGNSPSDLLVGDIIGEKKNQKGMDREVYVKPASQFDNIRFVFAIKRSLSEAK
ncbi:rod shape-determining protein MreC [Lactococcus laudensis]|uniref:Cell shape-determining protein MreC n=1 Tax=Pseudolactococcus laudensis TaxID=1494461 RepID=A0A7V8SJU3_9LACT|nr:rod shape-determining protein MreC [Lactococcus laudensis]MBA0016737.1 rod shape-determining protein MreC [Lactococcus laudensis]MBW9281440.1 rod shape-determining protein MreC [Lactococcus laudensis]